MYVRILETTRSLPQALRFPGPRVRTGRVWAAFTPNEQIEKYASKVYAKR